MDPREIDLVKSHLFARRLFEPPEVEEDWFRQESSLPVTAEETVNARLIFLKAFRALIRPVIRQYIGRASLNRALEVGAGTGFFSQYLAPDWLKRKLTIFDINAYCLKLAKERRDADYPNVLLASTYHLPFADSCFDALIGYSSFDSYLHLSKVIAEAKRVLKPGSPLILFQDLCTQAYDLEESPSFADQKKTPERYHAVLIETVKSEDLAILAGEKENDVLSGMRVEKMNKVRARFPDFDIENRKFPVLMRWDGGTHVPPLTKLEREDLGVSKEAVDAKIDRMGQELESRGLYKKVKAGPGDLVEWVTMRYLVARKSGSAHP